MRTLHQVSRQSDGQGPILKITVHIWMLLGSEGPKLGDDVIFLKYGTWSVNIITLNNRSILQN